METSDLYLRHLRPPASFAHHVYRILLTTSLFLIISSFALIYALGYHINWATYSLEQTGSIVLDSPRGRVPAQVYLDGKLLYGQLPARLAYLSPGPHDLSIQRAGFQVWHRNVTIEPNSVVNYRNVLLVRQKPRVIAVPTTWSINTNSTDPGLEIRGNEIWVNGNYITRVSGKLSAVHWFPLGQYIAYEADKTIYLFELDTLSTQVLVTTSSEAPAAFSFRNNGQILLYRDGEVLKAVELFAPINEQ